MQVLTNSGQLSCRSIYFGCVGSPGGMLTWKRQTSPFLSSFESVPASKLRPITRGLLLLVLPCNKRSVLNSVLLPSQWIFFFLQASLSKIALSKGYIGICCAMKTIENLVNICGGCNTPVCVYVGGFLTLVKHRISYLPCLRIHLIHSLS